MRRIVLVIGLLFWCFGLRAQPVVADLSLKIVEPVQNDTIPFSDTAVLFMTIKNNGPDDILNNIFYLTINGSPFIQPVQDTILVGDSITVRGLSVFNTEPEMLVADFCYYIDFEIVESDIEDNHPENDTSCASFVILGSDDSGIDQPALQEFEISLFPNPAHKFLNILQSEGLPPFERYAIIDASGRVLQSDVIAHHVSGGRNLSTIEVKDLKSGLYFIRLTRGESVTVKKIVIQ